MQLETMVAHRDKLLGQSVVLKARFDRLQREADSGSPPSAAAAVGYQARPLAPPPAAAPPPAPAPPPPPPPVPVDADEKLLTAMVDIVDVFRTDGSGRGAAAPPVAAAAPQSQPAPPPGAPHLAAPPPAKSKPKAPARPLATARASMT